MDVLHPLIAQAQSWVPRLCAHVPGTGGTLKAAPEDFEVEELPAYTPSGEGEHLFLWVEKKDVPAFALTEHVAQALQIGTHEVGCAGLKDARAVTRQYLSVPRTALERLPAIDAHPNVQVLEHGFHTNKLKTGHLSGNRFTIIVRDVGDDAVTRAERVFAVLNEQGLPNAYGAQRMGHGGRTVAQGLGLVGAGDIKVRKLGRSATRLALSALQSAVFNGVLRERMAQHLLHQVLPGDVMQVVASGGPFIADDVERETARCKLREVVITGPMPGPKMRAPMHAAAQLEGAVLASFELTPEHFAKHGKLMQGTRRPLVVYPKDLQVRAHGEGAIALQFSLPPGSYATQLMGEVMGYEPAGATPAAAAASA
jgi:tRNA pseudouridine13 synthase